MHGTVSTDLITIGITCFNAESSIERAVASAQAQTWPSIEIVVVDDCSTDGSWSVLERLARGDERVRVVRHSANQGVAAARNTVLRNATGAFVAFFDDDDVSRPDRLDKQHRRIVGYERATGSDRVVCYTATEQVYPDGTRDYAPCLGMDMTPAPAGMDVARLILLGTPIAGRTGSCPTSSQMARRGVFGMVDGFDEALRRHEDTDFNLRLALHEAHFAGLSEPLVAQTVTVSEDKTLEVDRRNMIELLRKHRQLLETWNWYDFSVAWCEMKFTLLAGGTKGALPHMARLFFMSPARFLKKMMWSFPNRKTYRKYAYHPGANEGSRPRARAG